MPLKQLLECFTFINIVVVSIIIIRKLQTFCNRVCVGVCVHLLQWRSEDNSFHSPCGSNSGSQAWQQPPFPNELSSHALACLSNVFYISEVVSAQTLLVLLSVLSYFPRTSRFRLSQFVLTVRSLCPHCAPTCFMSPHVKCQKTWASSHEEYYKNENIVRVKDLFSLLWVFPHPAKTKVNNSLKQQPELHRQMCDKRQALEWANYPLFEETSWSRDSRNRMRNS